MGYCRRVADYCRSYLPGKSGTAIASLAVLLGIAMLFSGIVDIVIFAKGRNYMAGAGWFLVDGILTVLLSLFIMGNQWFTALTLPLIFGMWLLFSGITKFVNSFDLQRLGVRGWGWFTALGVVLAVVGLYVFLKSAGQHGGHGRNGRCILYLAGDCFYSPRMFFPGAFGCKAPAQHASDPLGFDAFFCCSALSAKIISSWKSIRKNDWKKRSGPGKIKKKKICEESRHEADQYAARGL